MVQCNRCDDIAEYDWFENHLGKWRLGIKIDVGNYRIHECGEKQNNSKRNWKLFVCKGCGNVTKQNMKLMKNLNMCVDCQIL